jgi:hypothetical protein
MIKLSKSRLSSLLSTFLVLLFHTSSFASSFSSANIDPSSLKILVNNEDVTKRIDIVQNSSSVRIDYKLLTNLPATANSEFVIQAKTRATLSEPAQVLEAKSNADIVSKFAVAPIHIIKIPSYEGVLEDAQIATPVSVFSNGATNILYQEGDVLNNFRIDVPVFALDEKGAHLNIDLESIRLSGLSSGVSSGTASMTAGMAVIPLTISSSNLETLKLEVSTIVGGSSGAGAVLRPQALFVLPFAIPVITLTAQQAATVFIGLGLAANAILNPDPPRVPFRDWVSINQDLDRFILPISIAPPLPVPSGTCPSKPIAQAILINPNEAFDVPLVVKPSGTAVKKAFGDCKNQLPDWNPPERGSSRYNEIKRRIEEKRPNDNTSIFGSNSSQSPGRLELEKVIQNQYVKSNYPNSNRVLEARSQIESNKANNIEKITTEARWRQRASETGTRETPEVSLYGHLVAILQVARSAANYLLSYGYSETSGKNSPKICFTPEELDVLSVIQDMVIEILEQYNNWIP